MNNLQLLFQLVSNLVTMMEEEEEKEEFDHQIPQKGIVEGKEVGEEVEIGGKKKEATERNQQEADPVSWKQILG